MARRIDAGPVVAGAAAIALLASLFLDWFDPRASGWSVFEVLDLVLAGLALGALASAAGRLGGDPAPRGGRLSGDAAPGGGRLLLVLGSVALLIVASQMLDPPPAARGQGLGPGAWVALAGAAGLVAGGLGGALRFSLAIDIAPRGERTLGSLGRSRTGEASSRRPDGGAAGTGPHDGENEQELDLNGHEPDPGALAGVAEAGRSVERPAGERASGERTAGEPGAREERARGQEQAPAQPAPRPRPSAWEEARAIEPDVHQELYPEVERSGPIGADDPELRQ